VDTVKVIINFEIKAFAVHHLLVGDTVPSMKVSLEVRMTRAQVLVADYKQLMVVGPILCLLMLILSRFTGLFGMLRVVVSSYVISQVSLDFKTKEVGVSVLEGKIIEAHWPTRVTLVNCHEVLFYFV